MVNGADRSHPFTIEARKTLAEARREGKHTVLFRVKSNEGTKFVALPLGNA